MGDPARISRVAPDSRSPRDSCQAAAPGWASGREPGRGLRGSVQDLSCALGSRKGTGHMVPGLQMQPALHLPSKGQLTMTGCCEKGGFKFQKQTTGVQILTPSPHLCRILTSCLTARSPGCQNINDTCDQAEGDGYPMAGGIHKRPGNARPP